MDLSSKEIKLNQSRFYLNVTDNSPKRYTSRAEETLSESGKNIDHLKECQPLGCFQITYRRMTRNVSSGFPTM